MVWLLVHAAISFLDLPAKHGEWFREWVVQDWQSGAGIAQKIIFLASGSCINIIVLLSLSFALPWLVINRVGFTMANSLLLSIPIFFIADTLQPNACQGAIVGLAMGLTIGTHGGLFAGRKGALLLGIPIGLLMYAFAWATIGAYPSLVFLGTFWLFFFRLGFYPFYFLSTLTELDPGQNPYHRDAMLYLPLYHERRRLTRLALESPQACESFQQFLLKHRPLQRRLGLHLKHAVVAGYWKNAPLDPAILDFAPFIPAADNGFRPSQAWWDQFYEMKKALLALDIERPDNRLEKLRFIRAFIALRDLTRYYESPTWNYYYLPAFSAWEAAICDRWLA